MSCWLDIDEVHQRGLVQSLEAALASPSIPPEIVTALLNLAEFMEHDERPLPLDTRTLGALAEKCHAFAKVRRMPVLMLLQLRPMRPSPWHGMPGPAVADDGVNVGTYLC